MTLELLSSRVAWLEESKSDWEALCREMLATITLEGNKEFFAPLDETWTNTVDAWVDRFHAIEAAEQRMQSDICPVCGGDGIQDSGVRGKRPCVACDGTGKCS